MSGYREITVPTSETSRVQRPAPRRAATAVQGDWRAVLLGALKATGATCRNSPGTVFGSLVAMGAAGFICFNALGHQAGRHPAPILPKLAAQKAPPQRDAPPAAREPIRDAARDPVRPEADRAVAVAAKPAPRDPIGELIRSDETTASVTPKTNPARTAAKPAAKETSKEASKVTKSGKDADPVLRAQKALSKLGYPVKPDGAMGPGTRAAIEKFERSAKLPVTGEAAGRTLHELVIRGG